MLRPKAFSTRIAISGDRRRCRSAGPKAFARRTPRIRAAPRTLIQLLKTSMRMKAPGVGASFPSLHTAAGHQWSPQVQALDLRRSVPRPCPSVPDTVTLHSFPTLPKQVYPPPGAASPMKPILWSPPWPAQRGCRAPAPPGPVSAALTNCTRIAGALPDGGWNGRSCWACVRHDRTDSKRPISGPCQLRPCNDGAMRPFDHSLFCGPLPM